MAEPGPAGERIKLALESVSSRLGYAALRKEQEEAVSAAMVNERLLQCSSNGITRFGSEGARVPTFG